MAKNADSVSHKKSKLKDNGGPKLPLAADLVEGEIAINFGKDVETLSIKNESGDVVTFSSDNYYTEKKLGSGFTGENSANTVTSVIESVELWVSGTGVNAVVQKGGGNTASGSNSHSEGAGTTASGSQSHSEGAGTTASGNSSHAEGNSTKANGFSSHAEGVGTTASGSNSHAEGAGTTASGSQSHSEGAGTTASGNYGSHAEGAATTASGDYSHAEGNYTTANNQSEHASGQYNVSNSASTTFGDSGNTLFSVGNGTADNARHNAFEIRQNGDIYIVNKDGNDVRLQDEIGNITIDQTIDSGTSASTNAVSTSAVYGFVTSYTPSITVDQVLDDTTSASTNPVSSKAVYDAVTDNELVWTNAYVTLSGAVSSHTANNVIHVTAADKEKLHTHSNKASLDSITGNVGTMAYQATTSYSSATEVNSAFSSKVNNSTFTAHTANTTHMSPTEKTNLDSLETNIGTISGITPTDKLIHETMNRRTRTNFTSKGLEWFKATLKSAIADQSLEKYGLKVGDYYTVTHDGKTYNYVIAGLNTMKGTSTPYRLGVNHVGIIVDTNDTHAWNTGGTTTASTNTYSTGGTWTLNTPGSAYANCDLHYYLTTTVLGNVKSDLGSDNIKNHYKLYSTAVNTGGYNRFGSPGGCSSSWAWYANQEICALSEVQVYGSTVWSSSGYDTGEACRQLDVFRVYNMNEIFEGRYPWLRDVASASHACLVDNSGCAANFAASYANYVAALILFA